MRPVCHQCGVGKDATTEFDDVGHTPEARSKRDELVIGQIPVCCAPHVRWLIFMVAAGRGAEKPAWVRAIQ